MQRVKIIGLVLFLFLVFTACGGSAEEALPTLLPTVTGGEEADAGSPRGSAVEELQVPPTWTPVSQPTPIPRPTLTPETADGATGAGSGTGSDNVYVVEAGDTLAEIAADFNVALDVLAEVNNIEDIDRIEVGQQLLIPREP